MTDLRIDPESGLLLPASGGGGGGASAMYYKCASIDSSTQTWSGNKAILTDGVYSFEENVTSGLTFGGGFTPVVGNVYDAVALMRCSLYLGGYKFLRFQVDANRQGYGETQMSEFVLVDVNGEEVPWASIGIAKAESNAEILYECVADRIFDDVKADTDAYNKWFCTFTPGVYAEAELNSVINLNQYTHYRWYTAGESDYRDPISWTVYVSRDGTDWIQVSKVSNASVTTDRGASAGTWAFDKVD